MATDITLQEALTIIDGKKKFDIRFVTADKKQNRGGELIEMKNVRKHEQFTTAQKKKLKQAEAMQRSLRKRPNHYENSTRNVITERGEIRKLHIRLITNINGKTVL